MSQAGKFVAHSALLCDDVRMEASGKYILIGVYTDGIGVQRFPASTDLAPWLTWRSEASGPVDVDFRVLGPHDVVYTEGGFEAEVLAMPPGVFSSIPLGKFQADIQTPGDLKLQVRQNPGDWVTVLVLRISLREEEEEEE